MKLKKILSLILIILGAAGLIYGLFVLFNGNLKNGYAWAGSLIGIIFFTSGMGLLKKTGS